MELLLSVSLSDARTGLWDKGQMYYVRLLWCDSRAVPYGQKAFEALGKRNVFSHLLNSPGILPLPNWHGLKRMNPMYTNIYKIMLRNDYIAMKLTGSLPRCPVCPKDVLGLSGK